MTRQSLGTLPQDDEYEDETDDDMVMTRKDLTTTTTTMIVGNEYLICNGRTMEPTCLLEECPVDE